MRRVPPDAGFDATGVFALAKMKEGKQRTRWGRQLENPR